MDTYENNTPATPAPQEPVFDTPESLAAGTAPEAALPQRSPAQSPAPQTPAPSPRPAPAQQLPPQYGVPTYGTIPPRPAAPGYTPGYNPNYTPGYRPYPAQGSYVQPPVYPMRPTQPKKSNGGKIALCAALVVALVIGSCSITASVVSSRLKQENRNLSMALNDKIAVLEEQIQKNPNDSTGNSTSGTPNVNPEGGLTPAQVYAQNVESVVAIECYTSATGYSGSSGSGFVFTEDGYIVSNHHVVEGTARIRVILSDETEYDARLIGSDSQNDIALLKIEATSLRPAAIGNSDALVVGDQVAAIGNPLGKLASTLTVGYVSAKDRIVTTDGTQINMLQTDASINPGNSGGPLFNMKGEVIGITTAKYSGTTSSGASIEGIGFAIPMNDVLGMLEDLREHGYITGGFLGVTVSNMNQTNAQLYGLPMGVLVHEVVSGSCSEAAGVRPKDIITQLGGYDVENMNDLTRAMRHFSAGETVSLVVYRHSDGGEVFLSVTLDAKPQQNAAQSSETSLPTGGSADDWFDHFFG